jgi:hypothetical protein
LPREDTTPPVINRYLAILGSTVLVSDALKLWKNNVTGLKMMSKE